MNNFGRNDLLLGKRIYDIIIKEHAVIQQFRHELNATRGGKLYVKRTKKKVIYTEYSHGKERSIGRNKDKVHRLARRNYVRDQYDLIQAYYSLLKQTYDQFITDKKTSRLTQRLEQYRTLDFDMNRILLSPEQQKWLDQPYERNPAYPEELKFETTNNKLMRTKSELIIANRLEYYNVPYLPEMPFYFDYDLYPKYPDFTILKHDGSIIIWEHMGRMDKEDYFIKNSKRIIEYRQNGYSQNTNLIITFEEDIREPGLIENIIERRILL